MRSNSGPLIQHPLQRERVVWEQRAERGVAQLVGERGSDRAFQNGVAVLLDLADLARDAETLRAVREVGVLDRAAGHVIVQEPDQLARVRLSHSTPHAE